MSAVLSSQREPAAGTRSTGRSETRPPVLRPGWLVISLLVAVAVAWGLSFVVIKDAVADTSPTSLVGSRFGVAVLVLLLLRPRIVLIMDRPTLRTGMLLGLLLGLGFLLCTYGMQTTPVVASAFIVGTTVVFTPLVARVWLRQRLSKRTVAAVGFSVVGLGLLTLRGTTVGAGGLLIMGAALLWAIHLCGLGRWVPAERAYASTVVQLATASAVAWLVGAVSGEALGVPDPATFGQLLYLGAIATAASFVAVTWAQTRIDATTTAVLLTLEPVVGAVAAVALGEPLTPTAVLGAVAVLGASGLVVARSARATAPTVTVIAQDRSHGAARTIPGTTPADSRAA